MGLSSYLFTSESVSEGHPDKVSDRISDEVVDHFLAQDPLSRVACETLCTTNRIVLAGEVRCRWGRWISRRLGPEIGPALAMSVRNCIETHFAMSRTDDVMPPCPAISPGYHGPVASWGLSVQ